MEWSRKQYLDRACTHAEYYEQFVTRGTLASVRKGVGIDRLRRSTDEHLNDIPLAIWDGISVISPAAMKEAGDSPTLAGNVCIAKAAARILISLERRAAYERTSFDR